MTIFVAVLSALALVVQGPGTGGQGPGRHDSPSGSSTLETDLRTAIAASGAEVAVAFRTLDGRTELSIDADKPFHAASTMKVPVMIELFRQAADGRFSLEDPLPVRNQFTSIVDGSSYKLSEGDDSDKEIYAAAGKSLTLRQLNEAMITFNDGIPAGVPAGTAVAHKTGSITRIQHDAGIVYAARPYTLVILVRGIEDQKKSKALIAQISKIVYKAVR